jgi:signal transduction histidine kinase
MRSPKLRLTWRYLAVFIWITFTATLAGWWLVFGLRQGERLMELQSETALQLARHQRMLVSEGAILIVMVIVGGGFMLYFMERDKRHFAQVKEFFATYTHDLKTSLASLRLQGEALQEDLAGSQHMQIVSRLVKDTVRLELQLENSLYLAHPQAQLYFEDLSLLKTLNTFRAHWPDVQIEVIGDCEIHADSRALESILKNLIQNAIHHGRASRVEIHCEAATAPHVKVTVRDNGSGFSGPHTGLGQLFVRHNSRSGSGVGLYLVQNLVREMGGQLRLFDVSPQGFGAEIVLKGRLR